VVRWCIERERKDHNLLYIKSSSYGVYCCLQLFSTNARHCIPFFGGELGATVESARRKPKIDIALTGHLRLHLTNCILPSKLPSRCHLPTSINYATRVCQIQASNPPSGWPRVRQYTPAMLCSWHKPIDWPALSAHQVGVTNFQRFHAPCACHSIATTCICGLLVLRQAQRVALPSPQSGLKALYEANQTCWLQCWLHEALPCRQP
jgi:hypothetical protein